MPKEEIKSEIRDARWLPRQVYAQVEKIDKALSDYADSPKTMRSAERLINATEWPLNVIRNQLGEDSTFYIERSSLVVNCALDCMTEEVNVEHETDDVAYLSTLRNVYKLFKQFCGRRVDDATSQRLSDFKETIFTKAAPLAQYAEGPVREEGCMGRFWGYLLPSLVGYFIFILLLMAGC